MFKFELNQLIYYMNNNRVHSAPVLARHYVDKLPTSALSEIYDRFGASRVEYSTVHGIIHESRAFPSKEALLESL